MAKYTGIPVPTETYWNYQPTPARIVRIIVGPAERETFWHNGLEGTEREAVEVSYPGEAPFYLDNEGRREGFEGEGWSKVTFGRGGPEYGHGELPCAEVIKEIPPHESKFVQAMIERLERQRFDEPAPSSPPAGLHRSDFPSRQAFRRAQQKRGAA